MDPPRLHGAVPFLHGDLRYDWGKYRYTTRGAYRGVGGCSRDGGADRNHSTHDDCSSQPNGCSDDAGTGIATSAAKFGQPTRGAQHVDEGYWSSQKGDAGEARRPK